MPNQSFAESNLTQIGFFPESGFGDPPVPTPAVGVQLLRFNKSTLDEENQSVMSAQILPNRRRSTQAIVFRRSKGEIDFEASFAQLDMILPFALTSAWAGDVLKDGAVYNSFALEEGSLDIGLYRWFRGCNMDSFDMDCALDKIVECKMGIMGMDAPPSDTSQIDPATVIQPGTDQLYTAAIDVTQADLVVPPGTPPGAIMDGLSFKFKQNLRERKRLGSDVSMQHGHGYFEIECTGSLYLKDKTYADAYRKNQLLHLTLAIGQVTPAGTGQFIFDFPALRINKSTLDIPGANTDRLQKVTLVGFNDETSDSVVTVTKTIGALAGDVQRGDPDADQGRDPGNPKGKL
jgi:Phage tail tube protein